MKVYIIFPSMDGLLKKSANSDRPGPSKRNLKMQKGYDSGLVKADCRGC